MLNDSGCNTEAAGRRHLAAYLFCVACFKLALYIETPGCTRSRKGGQEEFVQITGLSDGSCLSFTYEDMPIILNTRLIYALAAGFEN